MSRQTALGTVLDFVKAELGFTLTSSDVGTNTDNELYTLIDRTQQWLAGEYDWPFLKVFNDVAVAASTRYINLPTMNFERPVEVYTLWNSHYWKLKNDITETEYNVISSGDNSVTLVTKDPILRWQFHDETQFEVWPVPTTAQTVRFEGQRNLTTLQNAGAYAPSNYNSAALLDLDDQMVVYFTAANKLTTLANPAAQGKLAMARNRFNKVRAGYPDRSTTIRIGEKSYLSDRSILRTIPIVYVH